MLGGEECSLLKFQRLMRQNQSLARLCRTLPEQLRKNIIDNSRLINQIELFKSFLFDDFLYDLAYQSPAVDQFCAFVQYQMYSLQDHSLPRLGSLFLDFAQHQAIYAQKIGLLSAEIVAVLKHQLTQAKIADFLSSHKAFWDLLAYLKSYKRRSPVLEVCLEKLGYIQCMVKELDKGAQEGRNRRREKRRRKKERRKQQQSEGGEEYCPQFEEDWIEQLHNQIGFLKQTYFNEKE